MFQTLGKYIRNYKLKYLSDQRHHRVSITTQTNVPSFLKVAFERIHEQGHFFNVARWNNKTG